MSWKKRALIGLAVLVGVAFVSTVSILAVTGLGGQNDPLVTLGYLTNKFKPAVLEEVDRKVEAERARLEAEFDKKIAEYERAVQDAASGTGVDVEMFELVTLSNGQTMTCSVGTELLLRIGTAQGAGSSAPALVNSTAGTTLSAGGALAVNNMYMVTIEGNGIKATAGTVKLLVRGDYRIS